MGIFRGTYGPWYLLALVAVFPSSVFGAKSVVYYYTDPQGTVLATADAQGNITSATDYAPFGIAAMGTPSDGPGYTGHVGDTDNGLIYMQARYYEPLIGRFLSVDPIHPRPGDSYVFNRFAYANNSPMVRIDPNGENAIITYRQNGSINITVPVNFSGPEANNPVNIANIKSTVASRWSGLYNVGGNLTLVNVAIVDVNPDTPSKAVNNISLVSGPTSDKSSQGASFVRGGNSGEWNVNSSGWSLGEAEHETGHLMGEGDHYLSGIDANGNRTSTAMAGYTSNLMGALGRNVITGSQNMSVILNSSQNIVVHEPPPTPQTP